MKNYLKQISIISQIIGFKLNSSILKSNGTVNFGIYRRFYFAWINPAFEESQRIFKKNFSKRIIIVDR